MRIARGRQANESIEYCRHDLLDAFEAERNRLAEELHAVDTAIEILKSCPSPARRGKQTHEQRSAGRGGGRIAGAVQDALHEHGQLDIQQIVNETGYRREQI